jgi:hypothetical protein
MSRRDGAGMALRAVGYEPRPASPSLVRSYSSFSADMTRSSILAGSVQLCCVECFCSVHPSVTTVFSAIDHLPPSPPVPPLCSAFTGSSFLSQRWEGALSYQVTVACCSWNGLACLDLFFSLFRIRVLWNRRSGRNTRHRPMLMLANSFCECPMLRRPPPIARVRYLLN